MKCLEWLCCTNGYRCVHWISPNKIECIERKNVWRNVSSNGFVFSKAYELMSRHKVANVKVLYKKVNSEDFIYSRVSCWYHFWTRIYYIIIVYVGSFFVIYLCLGFVSCNYKIYLLLLAILSWINLDFSFINRKGVFFVRYW